MKTLHNWTWQVLSFSCLFLLLVKVPAEANIVTSIEDMTTVVSAASLTLLRRDMSLNRRLYAWLLGNWSLQSVKWWLTNSLVVFGQFLVFSLCCNVCFYVFVWVFFFSGTDIKGEMVAPHPTLSSSAEEHMLFYFNTYSKDLIVQVLHTRFVPNL